MSLSKQLLFFFSALGAFNGLLLSLYFLFLSKPKKLSNYFLGALLLALSTRVGKSVFFYFNPDLSKAYLQIGLSGCFLIGPALYFFLHSSLDEPSFKRSGWKVHVLGLLTLVIVGGLMYPYQQFPEYWQSSIFRVIYLQWLIYLIISGFLLKKTFITLLARTQQINRQQFWLLSIYLGNFIIWIAYNTTAYTSYIAGAISFTFLLYLMGLLLFFHSRSKPSPKYINKKIEEQEAHQLLEQLERLMQQKELFKNSNLKLKDVSDELKILSHRLSQLLNDNLGKSFSAYINHYRIEAAKKLLVNNTNITQEAIGYECGFSSQSHFYATFKKFTGTTPAKFKKKLL